MVIHFLFPFILCFCATTGSYLPPAGSDDYKNVLNDLVQPARFPEPIETVNPGGTSYELSGNDNPPWRNDNGDIVDPNHVGPNERLHKNGWTPTKGNPCPNVYTVCCTSYQYHPIVSVSPCWNNCAFSFHPKHVRLDHFCSTIL